MTDFIVGNNDLKSERLRRVIKILRPDDIHFNYLEN